MTNLQLFNFEGYEVRVVGTPDAPEWIAADICAVLEFKGDAGQHLRRLDDDEKGLTIIQTPGGKQEVLTVNEPGLYRLIFKSRKAAAKRFQRWVYHEVLPALRKTGKYQLTPEMRQALGNFDFERCLDYAIDKQEKLEEENSELQNQLHYAMKCIEAHDIFYNESDWW